jgi:Recombinase
VASIKAEADRRAANVLPIIREAQKAGATTLRQIAEALNARGVATARGGQWYAMSVSNVLNRAWGDCRHAGHSGDIGRALRLQPLPSDAVWNTT